MKTVLPLAAALVLFALPRAAAMDVDLVSGDLSVLKGQTQLRVEYVYSETMKVGDLSEKEYVAKKKAELNEKEEGRGDRFEKNWTANRALRYQPKFEDLVSSFLARQKTGLKVSPDAKDAKYTLILTTTATEAGWNAFVSASPAFIDCDIDIVETANRQNCVAKIRVKRSPGRTATGNDWDPTIRIEEAYAKCGKEVGILIAKKGFK